MAKVVDNVVVRDPQTGLPVVIEAGQEIPAGLVELVGGHLLAPEPKRSPRAASEK